MISAPTERFAESPVPGVPLHRAVRAALRRRLPFGASVLAALLTSPAAPAAPLPAVFPLASLYPAAGGDGTEGFVLTGAGKFDQIGASVSAAGDVNGDGIDDVIVGSFDKGRSFRGQSYVVFGSRSFPAVFEVERLQPGLGGDGTSGFVISGIDVYDYSGRSVAAAGDVNGDGIDDVIIGAERADPEGLFEAGESYVVFGSTQGFPALLPLASLYPSGGGDGSRGFVLAGIAPGDRSGAAAAAAGDVNGDGIGDVIIGAYAADAGGREDSGESYVVFGSRQRFPAVLELASLEPDGGGDGTRGFVLAGIHADDRSGMAVSAAGDLNGDGTGDIVVTAPFADRGEHTYAGASYVVFGTRQGFPAVLPLASLYPEGGGDGTRGFVLSGIDTSDLSGASVSTAGDINQDGLDDVLISASLGDPGGNTDAGETYVVFGSTSFPAVLPLASLYPTGGGDGSRGFVLAGIDRTDFTGRSCSKAGDFNDDGIPDLIVGALFADPFGLAAAGESYVVYGSAQGFPPVFRFASLYPAGGGDGSRGVVLGGVDDNDWSGNSVSSAGDVNGDGIDDVIIGAYHSSPGDNFAAGTSYVVFGRAAR